MDKIFRLLGNFENIEQGFWNEFTTLKSSLKDIGERQKLMIEKMDGLCEKIDQLGCANITIGKACHKGFLQIKEGMEKLREELGEAAGVLVDHSYHDGSCPS